MIDLDDVVSLARGLVTGLLRLLWWLVWDFCLRSVGWAVGWVFFRICTFGRFPKEGVGEAERASWSHAVLVEVVGLALLGMAIGWIASNWSSLG